MGLAIIYTKSLRYPTLAGRTKGRRQEAARILGINRKTLSSKIERYHLRTNW